MKPPIWERQGRPKPPSPTSPAHIDYALLFRRGSVFRQWKVGSQHDNGTWFGSDRTFYEGEDFPTFAEAIAYADREARR